MPADRGARTGRLLRWGVLGYLGALLVAPVAMVGYRTFAHGVGPAVTALTSQPAVHALELTLLMVAVAVPLNTAFGVVCALLLVRHRVPGRPVVATVLDLPFAVSPVVLGLALYTLYGRTGWLGPWLTSHGVQVLFAVPGMVLATVFVSLPFVVTELVGVLTELGTDREQAAATLGASPWQTFRRVTLPAIRWALGYGVVLSTARALGEFGAVSVVSGNVLGRTQTLPLYVEDRFRAFDLTGAYAAGTLLALLAVAALVTTTRINRRREQP